MYHTPCHILHAVHNSHNELPVHVTWDHSSPVTICNREDQQEAFSRPHVLFPHRTELLLTSSI